MHYSIQIITLFSCNYRQINLVVRSCSYVRCMHSKHVQEQGWGFTKVFHWQTLLKKKSKFLLLNSLSVVDSLFILGPPPVLRWANKSSCTFFKVSLSINLKVKKKTHVFMLRIETLGSWFKKKSSLELEKFSTKALSWWRFFFSKSFI